MRGGSACSGACPGFKRLIGYQQALISSSTCVGLEPDDRAFARPHVCSSEPDGLAVSTLLRGSKVTIIELEDELPSSELRAQAIGPDGMMAARFQVRNCRSRHLILELDAQPVAKPPARRIGS